MTSEESIKTIFKSRLEELCFQSVRGGVTKDGKPMTVEGFWQDAGDIFDTALDALLDIKEKEGQ